jgi:hypothetical protein
MGVSCPSIESSDLTTARKIVPHATSPKGKKVGECGIKGRCEGKRKKKKSGKIQSE